MQHVSKTNSGIDRGVLVICRDSSPTKLVTPLPSAYTIVPPATLQTKEFIAPRESGPVRPPDLSASTTAVRDDYAWLRKVRRAIETSSIDGMISWSAYNADAHPP